MTPEDKVKLFYMANLYYMAGGNVPKRYANGSMVMPNQLQPSMPVMEQPNADLSTTKSLTALGMNPAIMGATGGASAAIAPIAGLAIDAWKFNRAMDNSYDQNAMMAEAVKKQQRQSSPYNTETGYMQGNFAHGGAISGNSLLSMASNKKGDPVKPIYIQDPNDPRLRAYNDSLNLYNAYNITPPGYVLVDIDAMTDGIHQGNSQTGWRNSNTPWSTLHEKDKIKPIQMNTYDLSSSIGRNFGTDITIPQYKKPVQPVILKKETQSPEQTARKAAPVQSNLAPVEATDTQLPDAKFARNTKYAYMPTNFGQTYYYEMDDQQKKWIPITQQYYNSNTANGTKNTQLYDSKPPGFAHGGTVPIWRMLSDDPSQFQMDENNNQQGGGNSSNYNTGGGIHIKEENRGKFTASAKRAGEGVQEHARHVLSDPNASPLQKKRANFARNAAKWHHADGGGIGYSIERDALLNNSSAPYAEGGAMSYPEWQPYGSNPSLFQMNQNNNNSPEYGIIPGNGNPKADDKNLVAELGAFVVPADKVPVAKTMLGKMGLNPDQQLSTMAPGAAEGGTPIRISSKEMYLSPDVKESMKLDMGMTDYDFEKTLSPNSPHNQHYTDPYLQHAKPSEWRNQGTNKFVQADHKVMEGQHLSPTLYAMARFADGGGFSDWWYNNMRSPQYREQNFSRSEMQQMAAEDEANLNNPDYSTEREINARNNAAAPEGTTTTPGSDLPEDFQKMNRNLLIANTVSSAGQGIYNLMQKYTPMPKPQMYRPEMYNADTSAMEEAMNRETQKAAATARYNARNVNQTYGTNAAIHANELESQISNAAKIQAMNADQAYKNTELKNQASLFNLQNQQSAAVQDSQNRYNFRAMKGQAVSQNIQAGLKGYQNYVNADLGMRALEKGYKAGMVDSQLYQKALNDPQSLTKEEIARINAITGGNFDPSKLVTETTAVE